jgi:hypothetical protein
VVDPAQHADSRNLVESILRYVPGFRGYLKKEYRRESDDLAREHIASILQSCKSSFDEFQRSLLDSGQIDELPKCERVRNRIDTIQSKLRGSVQGYSGFFDFVRVDKGMLDEVYEHDLSIVRDVKAIDEHVNQMTAEAGAAEAINDLLKRLDQLQDRVGQRSEILQGLSSKP